MIRVVVDTNIIISSVFWRGSPYEVVLKGVLREYQLVTSTAILDETADRLRNKFRFPERGIHRLVDILLTYSHLTEPSSRFDVVRDKKDNKILECAFDGKTDYIVTGDTDLLYIKEFKGIKIITAKEFLDEISKT